MSILKVMNSNMAKEAVDMSIKEVLKQKDKTLDVYFKSYE